MKLIHFLILCSIGALAGCHVAKEPVGSLVRDVDYAPTSLPYTQGSLILNGTYLPVEVRRENVGPNFSLSILVDGVLVDKEVYRSTPGEFSFVGLQSETFEPSIPLFRSPMRIGDAWSWTGTLHYAGSARRASADVTTSRETLNAPGGPYQTVRINVLLNFLEERAVAQRTLTFWLAPGRGVIKREFAMVSTREPSREGEVERGE